MLKNSLGQRASTRHVNLPYGTDVKILTIKMFIVPTRDLQKITPLPATNSRPEWRYLQFGKVRKRVAVKIFKGLSRCR